MKKLRIHVQGRVQGVGFRYTTKMLADQLGVTGSVKNESDGSVSIEAMGFSFSRWESEPNRHPTRRYH